MRRLETEVIVIGAGIVGLAVALELARRGRTVHVIERAPAPAAEASGAAAGMLAPPHESNAPGPFLELCLAARNQWATLASRIAEETGIVVDYSPSGFLHLALHDSEWGHFEERRDWQLAEELPVETVSADEINERFPMITSQRHGALFYPGDHHLHTGHALEALYALCRNAGVHFLFNQEVRDLLLQSGPAGSRVSGVHTDRLHASSACTVLAAGAWTGRLTAALGAPLPVEPVRGQVAVAPLLPEEGLPPCMVGSTLGYLVPRERHEVLAGATSEQVGFDRATTPAGINAVWQAGARILPALQDRRPAQQWAGLRPGSPDGLPILGPLPGMNDLWLATGHYRNGILLGPITGQIMADWIEQGDPGLDPTPYLPDRFLF